jgi:hypothetical protein
MFIFPLIFILYLGVRGITSEGFANFARRNLGKIKLIIALVFFLLGVSLLEFGPPPRAKIPPQSKFSLLVIKPSDCLTCNTERFIGELKNVLSEIQVSYLDSEDEKAKALISDFRINMLPAYLIEKEIKESENFEKLKNFLIDRNKDLLYFNPSFTGISYFVGRRKIPNRLDLFVSTQVEGLDKILEMIRNLLKENKDIDFHLHFLAQELEIEGFISADRTAEIEEYLRSVCMEKYNKEKFFDYLICRAKNIRSSWWESCAEGVSLEKIKECAMGDEGKSLLRENIRLTRELSILQAPVILLYNQEIFGITKDTKAEELKKFIKE